MKLKSSKAVYIILDILSCIAAYVLAMFIRFDFSATAVAQFSIENLFICLAVAILSVWLSGVALGTYRSLYTTIGFDDVLRQLIIALLSTLVFLLIKLTGAARISTGVTLVYGGLVFIMTTATRSTERIAHWRDRKNSYRKDDVKRAIIVGAGHAGTMLIRSFSCNGKEHVRPVAILDDNTSKHGMKLSGVPVCGKIEDAERVARDVDADEIIIAIPSADSTLVERIYNECKPAGIPIKIFGSVVDFVDFVSGKKHALRAISIEDLLFRDAIKTDMSPVSDFVRGKRILVTGGVGSIGSEICKQVLEYGCEYLVILDIDENGLFFLSNELLKDYSKDRFCARVGSIRDKERMEYLFRRHNFDIVLHAAAHKHVPMMEENIFEAVKNNIFGTKNTIECCIQYNVSRFVLISTDKAVNPTNVMGATKRVAEILVQRYNGNGGCEMSAVRFGNVLGSSGSVIPIFKKQIEAGGPVTVTHRDVTRYFMTIPEAVSLVLTSSVAARGGEVFVLDMGKPINIYDLACNMIMLEGYVPEKDIEIKFTGLRPGEKMFEELFLNDESVEKTANSKIFIMRADKKSDEAVDEAIKSLESLLYSDSGESEMHRELFSLISLEDPLGKPKLPEGSSKAIAADI